MTPALLDVNVLIALAWPMHVHHQLAHNWFAKHAHRGWATCPVTQLGFVRISSYPGIIPEAVLPGQALQVLSKMTAHPDHAFWTDAFSLDEPPFFGMQIMGHRQFTDAYLLAMAIRKQGKLATLDGSVTALLPIRDPHRNAIEWIH